MGGGWLFGLRIDHLLHAIVGTPTTDGASSPPRTVGGLARPLVVLCEVVYADVLLDMTKEVAKLRGMPDEELEQVESILEFLVECTQGPCVGNQEFLASTNVIEDCKRLLTSRVYVRQHPRYYYYYLFTNANDTLRTGTSSTATRSTTSRACATRRVF